MKAIHLNRYELLKADIDDHLEIIQSNLDTMDGCFDILVPKNIGDDDQIDFDALLRGEPIPKQPMASNYKDVRNHIIISLIFFNVIKRILCLMD